MKASAILPAAGVAALGLGAMLILAAGCQSQRSSVRYAAATAPAFSTPSGATRSARGGAELWAESCLPCHNIRSPSSYSDADWEVVMHHMRVRANLPAGEHQRILEFLKSAN